MELLGNDASLFKIKDGSTAQMLYVDLTKLSETLAGISCDIFGCQSDWGDIWSWKKNVNSKKIYSIEDETSNECTSDKEADVFHEIVNLAALTEYSDRKVDRRPDTLQGYIDRCLREGVQILSMGPGFVSLAITYYRKHAILGRRYARGYAAQNLTKEARYIAFGGHSIDIDIRSCHTTVLFNFLRTDIIKYI